VNYEAAASGRLDSQYATLEGIVHPLKFGDRSDHPILTFKLYTSIGEVHIFSAPGFPDLRVSTHLEDAKIRIDGVFASAFNARRQLLGYRMAVASPDQIKVLVPPTGDAFGSRLPLWAACSISRRTSILDTV
jgi:hypothetical protein